MTDIDLTIPDFLARPAPTPDEFKRLMRRCEREAGPNRKLKNPRKRIPKSAAMLGMKTIGLKVKS